MTVKGEFFKSHFGMIAALLGMAVGTGNIWRFPRVMSQNGGGAFLIPWIIFLFLWSIPLLCVEFSCGKKLRRSVTGCFALVSKGRFMWIGSFIALCTLGIMFYYSVVTGWCSYYFFQSLTGEVLKNQPKEFWEIFSSSITPLFLHILSLAIVFCVVRQGIQKGVEVLSRFMMPLLFFILIVLVIFAMTFPGREEGLSFIFNTDFSRLSDYRVWLEALTQSAWSTGAGWGLALTYASYAESNTSPILTPTTTGFGNNSIELLAVMIIIPTLFSFLPVNEIMTLTQSGNTGLTFIAMPGIFQTMTGAWGRVFSILFFAALFLAALTSLIAMFELGILFLNDFAFKRNKAIKILLIVSILFGIPSAIHMPFLDNQDWVWGIGLLVSGFFFTILVRLIGSKSFGEDYLPNQAKWIKKPILFIILWIIPLEFFLLIGWWFYQATQWDTSSFWNPLKTFSIGTCFLQWGILLLVLFLLNNFLIKRIKID